MTHFIAWLIIGAIAGWAAGNVMKGRGFGLVTDIIVGIVGSVIGGWLLHLTHLSLPLAGHRDIAQFITAFIGAVVLLFAVRLAKRAI